MNTHSYYAIHIEPNWFPFGYMTPTQAKGVQVELGRVELIQFYNLQIYLTQINNTIK
jgi:hypothetical protein